MAAPLSAVPVGQLPGEWPLTGRETELAAVEGMLAHPGAGGVVLVGPAGAGTSRLVREVVRRAAASGRTVRCFTATRAAATIPFGAFARLLAGRDRGGADRLELFLAAVEALEVAGRGTGPELPSAPPRLVVGVDDGHLLDQAGAALLHQLASTGTAHVVVGARAGEPAPEPVLALWKDGPARRLDVATLDPPAIEELLAAVLGGPLDGAAFLGLWRASRGNLTLLHELVLASLETGALFDAGGIWHWRGPAGTPRLLDLATPRLGGISPAERGLLELVALAGTVDLATLEAIAPPDVLDIIETAGFLEVETDGRRGHVRLASVLDGEALRSTMAPLRARAVRRRLAATVQATPRRRRGDLLRLAIWQLDAGARPGPDVLIGGAREAEAAFDHRLAERLARAARATGGGLEAGRLLARALVGQGRLEEADAVLEELGALATTDAERSRLNRDRAGHPFVAASRAPGALPGLRSAAGAVASGDCDHDLAALSAMAALTSGRLQEALDTAGRLLGTGETSVAVRLRAETVMAGASALGGRSGQALAAVERGMAWAGGCPEDGPGATLSLAAAASLAHRTAGRLGEAEVIADDGYRQSLLTDNHEARALWAALLGRAALARGRVRRAGRFFLEGVALSRALDPMGQLAWCLANLAQAHAQAGQPALASAALAEAETLSEAFAPLFAPDLVLARAWVCAARGETSAAVAVALEAAESAAATGAAACAAAAFHEATRFGGARAAAVALGHLRDIVEGDLVVLQAAHAAALAVGDGAGLDVTTAGFERLGADLLAAEAAAGAGAAHRAAGASVAAAAAAARAKMLAARCEGAWTPALARVPNVDILTPREREVATLAATGLSNREVATRLFVSLRTVENHLHRAFSKLGVTSRELLAHTLGIES
jgi:DNA-binding CsgD family transcriptional regulator/tetratricopeptide (TPR) repeat protein